MYSIYVDAYRKLVQLDTFIFGQVFFLQKSLNPETLCIPILLPNGVMLGYPFDIPVFMWCVKRQH